MKSNFNKLQLRGSSGGWARKLATAALGLLLLSPAAKAQLSGTYTVCSSGCNYKTVGDVANDLNNKGVSGPVTVDIAAGSYNESISLYNINGASATNTITFKGKGRATTRIYTSGGQVVYLDNASYVTFQDLHLDQTSTSSGYTIYSFYTNYVTFKNCKITSGVVNNWGGPYTLYMYYSNKCRFEGNYIAGGYYTAYIYNGSSSSYAGNQWVKNDFRKAWYVILYTQNTTDDIYDGNTFDSTGYNYGMAVQSYYESGAIYKNNKIDNGYNLVYGIYGGYPNYYGNSKPFQVYNNIINMANTNAYYGIYFYSYYTSGVNFQLYHNTLTGAGSNLWPLYIYTYQSNGFDIRNNNFYKTGSGYAMYFYGSSTDKIDGNNYYNGGGNLLNVNGTDYATLADWQKAAAANGNGVFDMNMAVQFKSKTDFHYDQTVGAPYGPYVGIATDIDGDTRCTLFPTTGADENNYGKGAPTAKFFGPSTVYEGTPVTFTNIAKANEPKIHKWKIDGVDVKPDSIHLYTTALKKPSAVIELTTISCGGTSTYKMTVTVTDPPAKPVSDFLADKNVIDQDGIVNFMDLSTNGPNKWTWSISPASVISNGMQMSTYSYQYGSASTPKNKVKFTQPGTYKVCLTAENSKGKGNTECKTAYIEVIPSVPIGSMKVIKYASGNLFDDGGPNGNYNGNTTQSSILAPCADSIYMVIKKFDMYCSNDYLRIYEGTDNKGRSLTGNCTSGFTGGPSGWWGCPQQCMPSSTDTIKAGGKVYIETNTTSWATDQPGFEIYWWSKPKSISAPVAEIEAPDSVCTNGALTFTNKTKGEDVQYLWDLDQDLTVFEYDGDKSVVWPFFFPGQYDITLVATNCGGVDTFVKTITVYDPKKPAATFTADNTNPTANDVVFLSTTGKECVDNYLWKFTSQNNASAKAEFVNGTSETSANPQVIFPETGCWDVELTVDNVAGSDKRSQACYIFVKNSYCKPTVGTMVPDIGFSHVVFNTINNTSTQGVNEYGNYISTVNTTVETGVKYQLTLERNSNKNKINWSVYFDWNADGDFDDAQETYAEEMNSSAKIWTVDVIVPKFANIGATVMRVANNIASYSNKPCGQNEYGEYEDYRIYITPDLTKPVLKLKGLKTVVLEQGRTYVDSGATAMDNLNGDITSLITMSSLPKFNNLIPADYVFTYNVTDSAGNKADPITRLVKVIADTTKPVLLVQQPETTTVAVGLSAKLPDILSANDLVDGDLTLQATRTGTPVFNKVGIYKLTYSVSDYSLNQTVVYRYVNVVDTIRPAMNLVGKDTVYHQVYTPYTDAGVNYNDNYYTQAELAALLSKSDNVNVAMLGTYVVNYSLTDGSNNGPVTMTRVVIVQDTIKPIVKLIGDDVVTLEVFSKLTDEGVTIFDNYYTGMKTWDTMGTYYKEFPNGKATKLGTYTVIYQVTDGSGNVTTVTRTIEVKDMTKPVIEIKGSPSITLCRWAGFTDPGYEVSDNLDAKADLKVTMEGTFIGPYTSLDGLFSYRYRVEDKSKNVTYSEYRYVLVLPADHQQCQTSTGVTTDVADLDKAVNVYPNPSNGQFNVNVNLPQGQKVRISVLNALGQEVTVVNNGTLQLNLYNVDLSAESAGVYFLRVQTDNGSVTKRVVLNK